MSEQVGAVCRKLLPDWAPMSRLLVGWPLRADTWRHGGGPAQESVMRFIKNVLMHTTGLNVTILVGDEDEVEDMKALRDDNKWAQVYLHSKRLSVEYVSMDDCWLRDTTPLFVRKVHGEDIGLEGVCFRFNAWGGDNGGCYTSYERDAKVAGIVCDRYNVESQQAEMVLEGGSVCSDGEGTLLVTEECVLNANRNAKMSKCEIENTLRDTLGVTKFIWLPFGAAFDYDTDGHVDNMAIFIRKGHVLLLWAEKEECEEQWRRSEAAYEVLQSSTDACGNALVVHKVRAPRAQRRSESEAAGVQAVSGSVARGRLEGERLCASYVNVVIAGESVFAPAFGDAQADARAERELCEAFAETGRKIVMVPAREIILGGGGLHCLTAGIGAKS
ncbi:Agmatine deiminase [Gracilariopsis chorda]|uniref:Agmatine deiminase n=1 Tax=Gracilariopsis chorda TaxID=448386 RepID=A0A2V3IZE8_9FLOR|nr:Agmatine deiminase [Gracilariopsis chorda]|eukprot:PXF47423.1 Agmatine deiminase [Gracilariopsis chorda]